jgi:hypothetical protein
VVRETCQQRLINAYGTDPALLVLLPQLVAKRAPTLNQRIGAGSHKSHASVAERHGLAPAASILRRSTDSTLVWEPMRSPNKRSVIGCDPAPCVFFGPARTLCATSDLPCPSNGRLRAYRRDIGEVAASGPSRIAGFAAAPAPEVRPSAWLDHGADDRALTPRTGAQVA